MEKENKVFGYCRISKKTQSIERQITNIRAVYPKSTIIQEAFTGTKIEGRKAFNNLLKKVKEGDTIVFDSVSRMSRNAEEGYKIYMDLYKRGINLVFLNEMTINTDTYKNALLKNIEMTNTNIDFIIEGVNKFLESLAKEQILKAFEQAEKEVVDLSTRTSKTLQVLKDKGVVLGRKEGTKVTTKKSIQAKKRIQELSKDFNGSNTDKDVIAILRITRNTYYKYKKELVQELQQKEYEQ